MVLQAPREDDTLLIAVGSTTFTKPIRSFEVMLPAVPAGKCHPITKLREETVIVCDWIVRMPVKDILDKGGEVPGKYAWKVREKLNELYGSDQPPATVAYTRPDDLTNL